MTTTPLGSQKLLPFHWQLDPNDHTKAIAFEDNEVVNLASRQQKPGGHKRNAGEPSCNVCIVDMPKYINRPGIKKLIPMSFEFRGQKVDSQALLDTGADGILCTQL